MRACRHEEQFRLDGFPELKNASFTIKLFSELLEVGRRMSTTLSVPSIAGVISGDLRLGQLIKQRAPFLQDREGARSFNFEPVAWPTWLAEALCDIQVPARPRRASPASSMWPTPCPRSPRTGRRYCRCCSPRQQRRQVLERVQVPGASRSARDEDQPVVASHR